MPRRKPFSNKQKKQQLQQKRQRKREKGGDVCSDTEEKGSEDPEPAQVYSDPEQDQQELPDLSKLNSQPLPPELGAVGGGGAAGGSGRGYNPNRFCLHFEKESNKEIERRKHVAKTTPITAVPETELEVGVEEVYQPGSVLDMPQRPPWSYAMSKAQLQDMEEKHFQDYLKKVYSKYRPSQLSYFEHNLETWRQLWRVLEMSDVLLLITDIRHPVLHFPPALYNHVVHDLKKKLVLVLNKVDLVPPQVGVAWRHYFLSQFPDLEVICFTSFPNRSASTVPTGKVKLRMRRKGGKLPSAVGPHQLMRLVEKMYSGRVDLGEWSQRLAAEVTSPVSEEEVLGSSQAREGGSSSDEEEDEMAEPVVEEAESRALEGESSGKSMLTIGMVGHPNVGKSSIINALMGKKLVSTSRTPGHTKHFQTLFLTPTLRVCDCPGLVFPSLVDKQLQVLSGIYPVAQVREPYSVVGYLAQRTPIIQHLQLTHPDGPPSPSSSLAQEVGRDSEEEGEDKKGDRVRRKGAQSRHMSEEREWTPWDICDAWALKRGYFTSRAARPDTYRAANSILRLAVDGRISMFFMPPGYSKQQVEWEGHPEVAEMIRLQKAGLEGGESRQFATERGEELFQRDEDISEDH